MPQLYFTINARTNIFTVALISNLKEQQMKCSSCVFYILHIFFAFRNKIGLMFGNQQHQYFNIH